ncbi:MAG: hypothetical protein AAGI01_04420, partial [Myxococcota bacterium]
MSVLRSLSVSLLLSVFLLCFVACGSDPTNVPDSSAGEDSTTTSTDSPDYTTGTDLTPASMLEELASVLVNLECAVAFECPAWDAQHLADWGRYPDRETCISQVSVWTGSALEDRRALVRSVEEGRLEFDAQKASLCLSNAQSILEGDACLVGEPYLFFGDPNCFAAFIGQVPVGGDCLSLFDCE